MIAMLDEKKALGTLGNYFNLLEHTGYVKHETMVRFLIYLFLLDFVENVCDYITDEDYMMIERAMSVLFTGAGCLLPYNVFCINKATLGKNWYMGHSFGLRVTEVGRTERITEDGENYRVG